MSNPKPHNPLEEPIVIVPKDPDSEAELVAELQKMGHLVQVMRDPNRALSVDSGKPGFWKPKLFIVDLILPQVSGFDMLRRLTDKFSMKKVPILLVSPYQSKEDEMEAYNCGAVAVLQKPAKAADIIALLEKEKLKKARPAVPREAFDAN